MIFDRKKLGNRELFGERGSLERPLDWMTPVRFHRPVDQSDPGTGNVLQAKTVIYLAIKTGSITLNKGVLHQKYVAERRSMRQIAVEFASSKTAI